MKRFFLMCLWLGACASQPVKTVLSTESISFELYDNRILVPVYLNGEGPFQFILDTGASGFPLVTTAVARRLNLMLVKGAPVGGAGDKKVKTQRTRVNQISVGAIKLTA